MTRFFPRETVEWKIEEPPAIRRLSLSLVEMALLTGVVLRCYRSLVLTHAPTGGWLYLGIALAVGLAVFFAMETLHIGNFPIHHWLWRAPAFAGLEVAGEMLVSVILIALHREPLGTGRAEFHDWPRLFVWTLVVRLVLAVVFAVLLAGIVQIVRYALLKRDHRDSTAAAIHADHVRHADRP